MGSNRYRRQGYFASESQLRKKIFWKLSGRYDESGKNPNSTFVPRLQVCQQVMYHAKAVGASPANSAVSSSRQDDANFKTPYISKARPPDGRLSHMNDCRVVLEKIPTARAKLLMGSESTEKKRSIHPVQNGNPVKTKKIYIDPPKFPDTGTRSIVNGMGGIERSVGNGNVIKPCVVIIKKLDSGQLLLYPGTFSDKDSDKPAEDLELRIAVPSKSSDKRQAVVHSNKEAPLEGWSTKKILVI